MVYRMAGKKTSVYLNPQLRELTEERPQPLSEALYRGLAVDPLLVEENDGGFTTHWYCAVPTEGSKFKVLRDHWRGTNSQPIREIFEVEITMHAGGDNG